MNTFPLRQFIIGSIVVLALVLSVAFWIQVTRADVSSSQPLAVLPTQGGFLYYRFFATSTTPYITDATSTVDTAAVNYATSTNIVAYTDSNGRIDNGYFVVAGAKTVEFYFGRGATSTNNGVSQYLVQITGKANPSESDWFNYYGLAPATTTSMTPTLAAIAQVPSGTSTALFTMNNVNESIYAVRCITVIKVDGSNTCEAAARF